MVVDVNIVNDCGIYCVGCPKKKLVTNASFYLGGNGDEIDIYCVNRELCKFLIERVHTTDATQGIFGIDMSNGGDKNE